MELAEIDDDDIKAFLVESYENLNQIERDIIELEKAPNSEALVRIYRSLHTLKGNCGFLPFPKLEAIAHGGESLLSCLRDHDLAVTPLIVTTLLQTVDTIRQILSLIETTKHEGDNDYSALLTTLTKLQEKQSPVNTEQQLGDVEYLNSSDFEASTVTASESSYIRVSVNLLDRLMNLVGELVLTRNQAIAFNAKFNDTGFAATCGRLNLIVADLQEGVMKTRLQPISSIWQKFPRVTRDLAGAFGKQVEVEMQGAETELDKSIIEVIKDPLTHLVRNCIDHGIELPAERAAAGKSTLGKVFLRASHESGKVNIEIGDDGRGIDLERLKKRAQQIGLVSAAQAEAMSETEAMNLIFLPGFSTAEQVTNLSGRGVGMDIVKSNIEKINGTIEIHSQQGQGTTFKLRIPLTLTIIPGLIVTSGGDRYVIPQASIQELVRIETEQARNFIEIFYDVPVYRLRGNLIPLIYLNQVFQQSVNDLEMFSLVIVQVDNYSFGIVVDTIEDIQDIVVKPLGKQLKTLSLFAGASILGDGRVVLIIDVVGLAKQAGVSAKKQLLNDAIIPETDASQKILLFTGPNQALMGVPLTMAFRLQEIPSSAVEKVGNQYVVQSYGNILPLIDLHQVFDDTNKNHLAAVETLAIVIVSPYPELSVGLVVDRILDIVESPLTIKGIPTRPGVLLSTVIQGKITEILDVQAVIKIANPHLLQLAAHG